MRKLRQADTYGSSEKWPLLSSPKPVVRTTADYGVLGYLLGVFLWPRGAFPAVWGFCNF